MLKDSEKSEIEFILFILYPVLYLIFLMFGLGMGLDIVTTNKIIIFAFTVASLAYLASLGNKP